jgi:hypothetical protein
MEKRFRFKTGTKIREPQPKVEVPTTPSVLQVSEDQVSKLVVEKLTLISNAVPISSKEDDFAFLEETQTVKTPIARIKLPKTDGKSKIAKLEVRRLVIEDATERVSFDKTIQEFDVARSEESEYKKLVEEGREIILAKMGDNEIYEGEIIKLTISKSKNESINAEAVVKALVCNDDGQIQSDANELKNGVQQLIDLARLGIVEIKKTDFDRWVKTHGCSSEPFLVKHADKKRIIVAEKR